SPPSRSRSWVTAPAAASWRSSPARSASPTASSSTATSTSRSSWRRTRAATCSACPVRPSCRASPPWRPWPPESPSSPPTPWPCRTWSTRESTGSSSRPATSRRWPRPSARCWATPRPGRAWAPPAVRSSPDMTSRTPWTPSKTSTRKRPRHPGTSSTPGTETGMSTQRILVVDDEPKIRMTVRGYLEADGFEVLEAADGPSGLDSVVREKPDLVVLDVMLPGLDGFEVLRRIRVTSQVPVILLTARTEEVDRVIGFTAGSDDYVTKPFSARELALRARAILRRADGPDSAPEDRALRFDGLVIDPDARTVVV